MILPIVAMLITSLLIGCTPPKAEKAGTAEPAGKIISRDQAIGELPCFRCHSFDKFSANPEKGVFAHRLHITGGVHCNQCHDFKGHKHISVDKD
ncbi:MAG TPA: hypothetical protein VJW95_05930, partial [Dissulfurispiraceae bacterium]|nr:hypothetical protein [Dissulfurispiraceae bacterium]